MLVVRVDDVQVTWCKLRCKRAAVSEVASHGRPQFAFVACGNASQRRLNICKKTGKVMRSKRFSFQATGLARSAGHTLWQPRCTYSARLYGGVSRRLPGNAWLIEPAVPFVVARLFEED